MVEIIHMQVNGYILKPIDFNKIESTLNYLIDIINIDSEETIDTLFGTNAK